MFGEFGGIAEFEERWRILHQPLGIYRGHFTHVFLCGLDQLVINNPGDK